MCVCVRGGGGGCGGGHLLYIEQKAIGNDYQTIREDGTEEEMTFKSKVKVTMA